MVFVFFVFFSVLFCATFRISKSFLRQDFPFFPFPFFFFLDFILPNFPFSLCSGDDYCHRYIPLYTVESRFIPQRALIFLFSFFCALFSFLFRRNSVHQHRRRSVSGATTRGAQYALLEAPSAVALIRIYFLGLIARDTNFRRKRVPSTTSTPFSRAALYNFHVKRARPRYIKRAPLILELR